MLLNLFLLCTHSSLSYYNNTSNILPQHVLFLLHLLSSLLFSSLFVSHILQARLFFRWWSPYAEPACIHSSLASINSTLFWYTLPIIRRTKEWIRTRRERWIYLFVVLFYIILNYFKGRLIASMQDESIQVYLYSPSPFLPFLPPSSLLSLYSLLIFIFLHISTSKQEWGGQEIWLVDAGNKPIVIGKQYEVSSNIYFTFSIIFFCILIYLFIYLLYILSLYCLSLSS